MCKQAAWWEGSIPWFVNSERTVTLNKKRDALRQLPALSLSLSDVVFLFEKELAYLSNCHSS